MLDVDNRESILSQYKKIIYQSYSRGSPLPKERIVQQSTLFEYYLQRSRIGCLIDSMEVSTSTCAGCEERDLTVADRRTPYIKALGMNGATGFSQVSQLLKFISNAYVLNKAFV
jgi:hypothetical protein